MFSKIKDFIKGLKSGSAQKGDDHHDTHDHDHAHFEEHFDTHYDMLYITHDAPASLIRAAYITLVRKYHPDRNLTNPEAAAMAQLVNDAYQVLSNPSKKAEHDDWIDHHKPKPKVAPPQKTDPHSEKLKAEAAAWDALRINLEKEAERAHQRAVQAAEQAKASDNSPKWVAAAEQAESVAKAAEDKAAKAAHDARQAAAKLGTHTLQQQPAARTTHYTVLKITRTAPVDIIECAYKTILKEHALDTAERTPEMASVAALIETAYAVLSDTQKRAEYDASLDGNKPRKPVAAKKERVPAAREKDLIEKAQREKTIADATQEQAERAVAQEKELEQKAAEAAKNAAAKAKDPDAAKWQEWAQKQAAEADAAKKRTQKAIRDAKDAKIRALDAKAAADAESKRAQKAADADAEAAAHKKAIRVSAQKSDEEQE